MRNISLLPAQMKRDIAMAKKLSMAATILLIIAIISLFTYGLTGLMLLSPLIELESMERQNIHVSSQISELKPLVELYNQVNSNVNEYNTITNDILPANIVIHGLCSNAPEGILLSRLNVGFVFSKGEQKAIVEGVASNRQSLALWMNNLNDNQYVYKVMCKTLEEVTDGNGKKTYRFTLEIPLKEGDQA
ncbi:MAG TPA: hypothetical protein DDZ89_09675 [Clostridiales bacterium]|nr:hypothetical protein [Clostridiales bacterium]